MHAPRGAASRGLRLVEALFLVGVVSVVAALAMARLCTSVCDGFTPHCRNNLLQLHRLICTYTSSYGGYLPAFWHERWVGELGLVGRKWGNLPGDLYPDGERVPTTWNAFSPVPESVPWIRSGAPWLVCKSDQSGFRCDQGCLLSYMGLAKYGWWHRGPDYRPVYEYHQLSELDEPDRRILLAETVPGTWQYGLCGCRWHVARHPVEIQQRHYGGGFILFFDSHTERVKDPEKRQIGYWEPDYDRVSPGWGTQPAEKARPGS